MSRSSCPILEMIAKWWYFFRIEGFLYLAYGFASLSHATTIAYSRLVGQWNGSYVHVYSNCLFSQELDCFSIPDLYDKYFQRNR